MQTDTKNNTIISKTSINRLIRDVKDMQDKTLPSSGIYYKHDDTDMLTGYALIIGPRDTPYFGGYYFFTFHFPPTYPMDPPVVTYETNKDNIRFHPNFYRTGKICISLLNTWNGEQWSACQNIKSVLLTICSLFDNEPLLNEPGITKTSSDLKPYYEIVKFANLKIAILDVLNRNILHEWCDRFADVINSSFYENKEQILCFYETNFNNPCLLLTTIIYRMKIQIDYDELKQELIIIKNEII